MSMLFVLNLIKLSFILISFIQSIELNDLDNNFIINRIEYNSTLSYSLANFLENNNNKVLFLKGQNVYVKSYLPQSKVNIDDISVSKLASYNSQIGIDTSLIRYVYYENKMLIDGRDYFVNYIDQVNEEEKEEEEKETLIYNTNNKINKSALSLEMNSTVAHSQLLNSTYKEEFKDNYLVECNLKSSKIKLSKTTISDFNFYSVKKFRTGSFGLKKNTSGIYFFNYSSKGLVINNILKWYVTGDFNFDIDKYMYKKIFVIDQPYVDRIFLVGLTIQDKLHIFEISLSTYGVINGIYYHSEITVFDENTHATSISCIGFHDDNFIIGTNYGLFVYQKQPTIINPKDNSLRILQEDNQTSSESLQTSIDNNEAVKEVSDEVKSNENDILIDNKKQTLNANLGKTVYYIRIRSMDYYFRKNAKFRDVMNVVDISVNQNTLYVLIRKYGIKIFNLSNYGFTEYEFLQDNLASIELVVNPILNTKYITTTISEDFYDNEYMIELQIDNEWDPQINKIYLSNYEISSSNYNSIDLFLGAIYNKYDNNLLLFRRGMINNIPSQLFKINLTKDVNISPLNNKNVYISSFYNSDSELNELAIIDVDANKVYLIDSIELPKEKLICKFKKEGNYNITLQKYSEACSDSLIFNYAYSFCNFAINLSYNVVAKESTDYTVLAIVLGSLFGFLFLTILLFLTFKTQCCTDFSMFNPYRKKKALTREELYRDNFLKKNNKADNHFNFNSSMNISGSNFNQSNAVESSMHR